MSTEPEFTDIARRLAAILGPPPEEVADQLADTFRRIGQLDSPAKPLALALLEVTQVVHRWAVEATRDAPPEGGYDARIAAAREILAAMERGMGVR